MRFPLLCLLLQPSLPAAAAPRPLSASEQAVLNFGFATQLGSGIYSLSGRTLQVYQLPFGYALPQHGDASRLSVRLTLPLTIGFLDFEALDVIDTGLPEQIDSFGVLPGIELDFAVNDEWHLEPFAGAGIAREHSRNVDQRIYSLGLRSRYELEHDVVDWQVYGELVRVVVEQVTLDDSDDFTRLRVGATARRPFVVAGAGRRADFLAYGFAEAFTDAPAGPADTVRGGSGALQFEAGFTLGATEPLRIWRIPLPRIGFGYRFGDELSVYRIVFGSPY